MQTRRKWLIAGLSASVVAVGAALGAGRLTDGYGWRPKPAEEPSDGKLRIIVFGAHPDDAEIRAGGVGAMWAKKGHHVKLVSLTNGDLGHRRMAGGPLAQRRTREVKKAAKVFGIDAVEVLDIHDGELMPTLENRKKVVRLIREWKADVVITHRPNDYHPDHRNTGLLVRDASFMVQVPYFCPQTPYLEKDPVFLYGVDLFKRPNPFRPDVVVNTDGVLERKLDALLKMESQFIEGGCCSEEPIPKTEKARKKAAKEARKSFRRRFGGWADRYRDRLVELYGEEAASEVESVEAFQISAYGRQPSAEELEKLFPFEGLDFQGVSPRAE